MKLKHILNEMAAQSLVNKIKTNDRIIMTDSESISFKNVKQDKVSRSFRPKPRGLWYAVGVDWIGWVRSEMPEWEQEHLFKVELGSKIIKVNNRADVEKFEHEFGVGTDFGMMIDWEAVAKKYNGIELIHYNDFSHFWTYGWDVRSGCIWNKSGIKKITKIK